MKKGEKLQLTGDIYEESDANIIKERVRDETVIIKRVEEDKTAPYYIGKGFVKKEELFKKCE